MWLKRARARPVSEDDRKKLRRWGLEKKEERESRVVGEQKEEGAGEPARKRERERRLEGCARVVVSL